jgi:hypothetical protein
MWRELRRADPLRARRRAAALQNVGAPTFSAESKTEKRGRGKRSRMALVAVALKRLRLFAAWMSETGESLDETGGVSGRSWRYRSC